MTRERAAIIGVILGIALVVAVGLWFGGGCALLGKINAKRPPLLLGLGSIYRPHVSDAPHAGTGDNWNLLGRVTIPTRPVGIWADAVYNFGQSEIQSTSFGFILAIPPGLEGPQPIGEEEEELIEPTDIHQLPPQ